MERFFSALFSCLRHRRRIPSILIHFRNALEDHPMFRPLAIVAASLALLLGAADVQAQGAKKPNIIVILADDLGYADIGAFGGKDIPTPHIDSIGKNGTRCTQGYVSGAYCSP